MELIHDHAQGKDHRRACHDQQRSDKISREGAVVVAKFFSYARDEVVHDQPNGVTRHRKRV